MGYKVICRCDKCGAAVYWENMSVSLADATDIARRDGWQIGKKGWFCKNCRATKRRAKT